MAITPEQSRATLAMISAIADTIRDLGSVPGGHLYARLMEHGCTLAQYESIIGALVGARLVRQDPSHLLVWIGPEVAK